MTGEDKAAAIVRLLNESNPILNDIPWRAAGSYLDDWESMLPDRTYLANSPLGEVISDRNCPNDAAYLIASDAKGPPVTGWKFLRGNDRLERLVQSRAKKLYPHLPSAYDPPKEDPCRF